MRRLFTGMVIAALATLATPALARSQKGDWELGAHLGRTNFIDNNDLKDDTLWGVNAGYCLTDVFELALNYDTISPRSSSGSIEQDLMFVTLDSIWNLGYDAHKPFALLGVGLIDENTRLSVPPGPTIKTDRSVGVVDLGVGYRGYLTHLFAVRLEGRLSFTDDDRTGFGFGNRDLRLSLGVAFNLHR